jgi:hypothetical protein
MCIQVKRWGRFCATIDDIDAIGMLRNDERRRLHFISEVSKLIWKALASNLFTGYFWLGAVPLSKPNQEQKCCASQRKRWPARQSACILSHMHQRRGYDTFARQDKFSALHSQAFLLMGSTSPTLHHDWGIAIVHLAFVQTSRVFPNSRSIYLFLDSTLS